MNIYTFRTVRHFVPSLRIAKNVHLYHNYRMKILCVCLSATIQRTLCFNTFSLNQVNRTNTWREDASGKGVNACRVLNQLEPGCSLVVCPVGNANAGHFLSLAAHDDSLQIHPIYIEGNTRTCWTLLDDKNCVTTEVVADEKESPYHLAGAEAEIELMEAVKNYMRTCDALLLAGSRPAQWSANICARICDLAIKAGKTVLADFRGEELLSTLKICTPQIIKINQDEYCQTFGLSATDEESLISAITAKSAELHNIIIITRGEEETLTAQDGKIYRTKTEKLRPVNTTACGDSFGAGFLYEYLNLRNTSAALAKATWCAARNAQSIVPGAIR